MTQKDKDLLLRDLCARLPYGVCIRKKVCHKYQFEELQNIVYGQKTGEVHVNGYPIKQSLPYLRPMSSMTEEEKEMYTTLRAHALSFTIVSWLDEHMFDHRTDMSGEHLIELGLALEAPEDMYN